MNSRCSREVILHRLIKEGLTRKLVFEEKKQPDGGGQAGQVVVAGKRACRQKEQLAVRPELA